MKPAPAVLLYFALFLAYSEETLFAQKTIPVLITEKEATMPDIPDTGSAILEMEKMKGPVIRVNSPKNGETYPRPIKVDMEFISPENVLVDIKTLQVLYVKLIEIDITDRIKPFATEKGIFIPEADIPKGRHKIKITIADAGGNKSSKDLIFMVK
ncbi:MAG: hypothetical protein AB1659_06495 [Thermodesulfobacteriota bacterium]